MKKTSNIILIGLLLGWFSACSDEESIAEDDSAITIGAIPVRIQVLHNDKAESVASFTSPGHGELEIEGNELIYTAEPNFSGPDTFTYTVEDAETATASVEVTVLPGDGTVAGGQLYQVVQSEPSSTVSEFLQSRGFFWIDANNRGDAIGDYGPEDGSGLFVRWADGSYEQVPVPTPSVDVESFGVVGLSGINDDGLVTGWYFNEDYTIAGSFLWETGQQAQVQLSSESRDMLASDVNSQGVMVGYTEDYDESQWVSFIGEAGSNLDDAEIITSGGFNHTMLFSVNNNGIALGTVSNGGDGWYVTYPKDCFTLDLNDDAAFPTLLDRPAGVFYMDCRDINSVGVVVGKFYYGETNEDRIYFHNALLHGSKGFTRVDFPINSPEGTSQRREELLAVTDDGRLYGNIVLDSFDEQTYIPLEFTPVEPMEGVSYDDTNYDYVGEAWLNSEFSQ